MATALLNSRTYWPTVKSVQRGWFLFDAEGQILGRLASRIAHILMGKDKPLFTPSVDCGNFVVVVNAGKIELTGRKLEDKHLFYHTGHPGGSKVLPYKKLYQERPERILFSAVKKMLPRNKHSSRQVLRLKIYRGSAHPHGVQNPEPLKI
jgi:large subunit ribosomal protein L13